MAVSQIEITLSNGAKAGDTLKELRKQAAALNKEINDLKPGTDEFVKKSSDLQKVGGRMDDIRKQIKGTTEASNELFSSFKQFIPFSGTLQKVGQNLGFVQKGVGGLTSSLGAFRTALVSTGIGAIVVVLGLLINYLTSTQEGIDKVTAVTRPLQAIFEKLKGVLQELGGKLFKQIAEAIKNPRQAIIDLGNAIKDNLIARVEALAKFGPALAKIFRGEFASGFKDLGNAVIQVTTGIENGIDKISDAASDLADFVSEAVKQGQRLDALQKQIEKAELAQITRSKQLQLVIAQQKAIVEDETASYDARRQAAQNALTAQQALLNSELALLDKRIEKMKLEHSLNDTSREEEKELAELYAKRLELQAQTTEKSIEFNKKISALNKKEAAEELAIVRNLQDLKVEAMAEGMDKEIEQIELDTERRIEALTGSQEQIRQQEVLLEEIRQQEIQAVRDKYAAEQAEKDKKAKDEQEKRDKELADKQKKIAEDKAKFESDMADITNDIALDSFGFATELSAKQIKNEQDAKIVRKTGALIDIGINLQRELAANSAAYATFGPVGIPLIAAANLRSIIRSGISAAKVIAFRKGGVLRGPSHEGGGVPMLDSVGRIYGNAEGDEIVLTKGVYRNPILRRAASALNVLGGGRQFESGGPINPISQTSTILPSNIRNTRADAEQAMMDVTELKSAFMDYAARVDSWASTLKVQNVVTETEEALNVVNKIRDEADV